MAALDLDALVGTWALTMRTPIGSLRAELLLRRDGDRLVGAAASSEETVPLLDLEVESAAEGDRLRWRQSITRPLRLNLEFDVIVTDGTMTGTSRAGKLPRSTVTGTRTGVA